MHHVAHLMHQAQGGQGLPPTAEDGHYTPAQIREGIHTLAAQGRMPLAQALVDAGLSLHPDSPDLLAMASLMALTRGDWGDATLLLEQLLELQGTQAPAMTYRMLVRALRCNLEPARAQRVLWQGLQAWPEDEGLRQECDGFMDEPCLTPAPRSST